MSSEETSPVLRIMGKLNHVILIIEKTVLIILMVGMLIFGFLQVFSRFILKAPIGWSEELLTYSFTWASFMGASMAIYTNSHFSVDLITKHFSPKFLKIVRLVIWTLVCLFAIFLVYMGTRLAIANNIQRMNILPISMFWAYLSMPISGLFIVIHGVEKTAEVFLDVKSEELEDLE